MANKRPKPEEIVAKLRQVEVLVGQRPSTFLSINSIVSPIFSQKSTVYQINLYASGNGHPMPPESQ